MPVRITVAIPTHDRRETLLLAVRSALEQTRPSAQVIVIADGCSDGTQEAIADLGEPSVELLDLPKGPGYGYGHRNLALERARGDVVAWLGDDDLYLPDHLERVGMLFDTGDVDLVQATAFLVDEAGGLAQLGMDWRVPDYRNLLLSGQNRTPSSAVSHLRDAALAVGGWHDDLPRAGDMDLWQRMLHADLRPGLVGMPTVLHFRASGREQSYGDRIAQNAAFLERLRSPLEVARLRSEMAEAAHRAAAAAEMSVAHERAETARELERLRTYALEADRELERLRADAHEADRVRRELDAVYAGGWWRLRARLLPVLRLLDRVRNLSVRWPAQH